MPESYDYTAPVYPAPPANRVTLIGIQKFRDPWSLHFTLRDDTGRKWEVFFHDQVNEEGQTVRIATDGTRTFTFSDTTEALIKALNKANLSTKSEERRVYEKLVADGFLSAGTITGSPD